MSIRANRYKDARLQAAYDGAVENYLSGARGWISPGHHGMWNEDGTRFSGATSHSAFWKGFDGIERNVGNRLMYVAGSHARAVYMAGRDCSKMVEVPE